MNVSLFTRRRFLLSTMLSTAASGVAGGAQSALAQNSPASRDPAHDCFICVTCGVQYAATDGPPRECPVCLDERQYVGLDGQQWTTLNEMRRGSWANALREQESNLVGIGTEPKFAIGQRALLVRAPGGNILWDCTSFVDEATIRAVRELGGIAAIAISHPHYYSSMIEWSRAFDHAPIHLHEADRQWVQRPDPSIHFWRGETKALAEGLTLIHTAGHFDGFQVLHWRDGAEGRGVVLSGDQPQVAADRRWVSFMWSYPNFIPLSAPEVRRIVTALEPWPFERLYGAFWPSMVAADAKGAVRRSADRYIRRMGSESSISRSP
ncbi:MAG: MBL fold metallo-hydrolase [Verrucomicrobiota bacterium]|nr:MBL fold metallo-hydrolase [Verrucomicrobiota bacterium]